MEILGHPRRIDPRLVTQLARHLGANPVEVLERIERLLLRWNVDAEETGHGEYYRGMTDLDDGTAERHIPP